jgi:hypothetical protein
MPAANTILMIRPAAFGFNTETAENNFFQKRQKINASTLHQSALRQW